MEQREMTERKFTDEEVIKALECCLNEDCENCPARMCCDDDTESFVKYVFDLITRQKAEIERLNFENLQMVASIKRLKSEAIKEFAERLCEGRVSNDPIVIAVKSEIKLMEDKQ